MTRRPRTPLPSWEMLLGRGGNLERRKQYRRAMDLRSKAYGNRSGPYALCLSDLVAAHRARHEYDKAECLKKSLLRL